MDVIFCVTSFLLGICIASFCGVVVYRVPKNESIIKPDSYCPNCKNAIRWYDNIPILSYIILRGKCRDCKEKIGIDSLILEILGGVLFVLVYVTLKESYALIVLGFIIVSYLLILSFMDYYNHEVNAILLYSLLGVVIIYVIVNSIISKTFPLENIIGAVVGGAFFFILQLTFKVILKKDALGDADVIFIVIVGALVGYKSILICLLVCSIGGLVIEVIKSILKKKTEELAFLPYLSLGMIVSWLYGQRIIEFITQELIDAIF